MGEMCRTKFIDGPSELPSSIYRTLQVGVGLTSLVSSDSVHEIFVIALQAGWPPVTEQGRTLKQHPVTLSTAGDSSFVKPCKVSRLIRSVQFALTS